MMRVAVIHEWLVVYAGVEGKSSLLGEGPYLAY